MHSNAGSDGAGRAAAAAGSLDTLSDPSLASLPSAELVVHLYCGGCRRSDFSDAALVLADRERRAADAEARIRAAHETEARLRAEIHALQRRAHDAEARARRLGWSESDDVELEAGEIDPELAAAQDPAAAAVAEDDDRAGIEIEADVDPDDKLTLRQYLKKLKLLRIGGRLAEESGSEESNTRGNNDDWEKLRALAIVPSSHDATLDSPTPLEVVPPGNGDDLLPNHDLLRAQKRKMAHQEGSGDNRELQNNNVQGLSREMMALSPVSLSRSSPVATHSEAGGGMKLVDPSNSSMPPRADDGRTRENGLFYSLVFERLRERENSILREAAPPAPPPDLRCWLFAPEPSESVAVKDDPHGKAPQQ